MIEFKNQLKRDYQKDPLKYGESPEYEDLYFLYITCNLTKEEMSPYFDLKPCTVASRLKKAKIEKPIELKVEAIKRKTFEKYGDTSYSRLQECKDKVKNTSLKNYGVENPNQCKEVRDKIKKTNLQRYGVEAPGQNQEIKNKTKQTNLEKYGVEYYTQTEQFKKQSKETCLQKYGCEYGSQAASFQQKVQETNMSKYGVPYALMSDEIIQKGKQTCLQKWGTSNISTKHIDPKILELINNKESLKEFIDKFEVKDLAEIASILGISYDGLKKKLHELDIWDTFDHKTSHGEKELTDLFPTFHKTKKVIPPYEIDLYNEQYRLGIEYNGNYWHSELFKTTKYHQEKSAKVKIEGSFLFHIFEYEWQDERKKPIIISMLNNLMNKNNKIGARKCIIKEISAKECNMFLDKNHLQGKDSSSVRIGLYYQEELVSVMTFCKPRFNKEYEWELSRFCNKLNTSVIGSASKLFNYFIKSYNPQNIISYSNVSKTRGCLYTALGFEKKGLTSPNYKWIKGIQALSRYQCQKHLLVDYSELGSTEDEIMHNRGFLKLYDCGNLVWSWNK